MMPTPIALIGYGGIGRVHAMAYRSLNFTYALPVDLARIVAVATTSPKSARAAAAEIGCGVWSDDWRTLIARPDVEAIDCCIPNQSHEEVVIAAANAGKHVYCEKPLSHDLASGRRIAKAVHKAGIKTQMTFNFRFFPALMRAQQLIQEGFLGDLFSFRGRYYRSSYIDPNRPLSWRLQREHSGGGALFDLGSHLIDLVCWLLGDVKTVNATLKTLIEQRPISSGASEMGRVDVDDIVFMQMEMRSGLLGMIEVSRMGTGATNDLQIEMFGAKGAIRFNAAEPGWLEVFDQRDPVQPIGGMRGFRRVQTAQRYEGQRAPDWSMPPNFERTHAECQYRFLIALREGSNPSPTIEEGLRVQEVMEAAIRSSQERRWYALDELDERGD